jgi:hypothetical protein
MTLIDSKGAASNSVTMHAYSAYPAEHPDSFDDLHGPSHGRLVLPLDVYWGPDRQKGFDLSNPADVVYAYSEVVANATADQQERMLNRKLLVKYWPELSIDVRRIRPAWEKAFPALRESMAAWKTSRNNVG